MRDMVSTVKHEDSIPLWLVSGHPLWLSKAINESGGESDASSLNYIPKPFPEHEFEPHGWHDILFTLSYSHWMCVLMSMQPNIVMIKFLTSYP